MKLLASILSLGLLLAIAVPADAKNIRKEKDFRSMVVDKKMVWDKGWGIVSSDGTIKGKFNGSAYTGKWVWSQKYYCRNVVVKGKEVGSDCLTVKINGSVLTLTHKKGKGRVFTATME
ncbi:MAG: hypothetical protein GY947_05735 [Rhodobacteraceae bacterium]|nr:hypothetical protein [Paracoccaceae bacterium]